MEATARTKRTTTQRKVGAKRCTRDTKTAMSESLKEIFEKKKIQAKKLPGMAQLSPAGFGKVRQ
jgi:hypothetical protein